MYKAYPCLFNRNRNNCHFNRLFRNGYFVELAESLAISADSLAAFGLSTVRLRSLDQRQVSLDKNN